VSDAELETAPEDSRADADRRVLRRAALAGTVAFVATAVVVLGLNAAFGGDGQGALVWFMAAIVVGLLVWSGWLVLVLLLDVIAGTVPGRRRLVWTAVAFVLAFVSPILPAAALQAAAGS
jgi:hypothetical protein